MALSMKMRPQGLAVGLRTRVAPRIVCKAVADDEMMKKVAVAAVVAAGSLGSAAVPEAAIAARSGGRVGSSAGFGARRAAPSRATGAFAPRRATVVNNYSTTVVGSPFGGFSPFGLFRPVVYMPFPFLGGLVQFLLLTLMAGFVLSVVKGAMSGGKKKKRDDDWDQL